MAWAQVAGNLAWYSIEHADNRNPNNPLTDAQIAASAQLVELLSRFAGFPLQVTNSVTGKGYGVHYMGGKAWGDHTCPDLPPATSGRTSARRSSRWPSRSGTSGRRRPDSHRRADSSADLGRTGGDVRAAQSLSGSDGGRGGQRRHCQGPS